MTGAGRRRKGHDFERWVAGQLRPIWPDSRRGLQYQDGTGAPDVINTPYHIECKRGRKTDIKAAMLQAETDAGIRVANVTSPHNVPQPHVAITKDDEREAMVTMRFADWLQLVANQGCGRCATALPSPNAEPYEESNEEDSDTV